MSSLVKSQPWQAVDRDGNTVFQEDETVFSRLYYEAHITIPPLEADQIADVDQLCAAQGWRRSTFEMHKDGLVPNAFVSARHVNRDTIVCMVHSMVCNLRAMGYKILRWKIEDTLLDSSKGDTLGG